MIFVMKLLATAFTLAATQGNATAAAQNVDSAQRRVVLEKYAGELENGFVYPDIGRDYAALLRVKAANGAYSGLTDARAFASAVTNDLQALHSEGHLKLLAPGETMPSRLPIGPQDGVGRAGWLSPRVAYIELLGFEGEPTRYKEQLRRLRAALDSFSTAKTIVFDVRSYGAGNPREASIVAAYLISKPTTLLKFDVRADYEQRSGPLFRNDSTMIPDEGPPGVVRRRQVATPNAGTTDLRKAKIFMLIGPHTTSAGEGFSLSLKQVGRVTLVGERTAGAGHFGPTVAIGFGFRSMIPAARPFDPKTGQGWELVGLTPDVQVPSAEAPAEALKRIGIPLRRLGEMKSIAL